MLIVFDYDGCFTDGKVIFNEKGEIIKGYQIKDGTGLKMLRNNNHIIRVISGYPENESQKKILEHLKINKYEFAVENKKELLDKWCVELNLNIFQDVAYFGDDLNDLECLENVEYSGCPADAVMEVKNICKFISSKKGGDGCIREFCNFLLRETCPPNIKNFNDNINRKELSYVRQIKRECLHQLNNYDEEKILEIAVKIQEVNKTNNIYFTGIGKSETIAQHGANLLKSLNFNCLYLDATNSIHGDLGCVKEKDLVFLLSKSGNTEELIKIIPFLKKKKSEVIGVCCHSKSRFHSHLENVLVLPFLSEIKSKIDSIPTNSYMSFLFFINILASHLTNNLTLEEYKLNHPSGNIGNQLLKIKDVMITQFPKIILQDEIDIKKVLLSMTEKKIGCCFFVNEEDKLLGILTDGDIRRLLIIENNLTRITENEINKNFYFETDLEKYVKDCNKICFTPILNFNKKIIGIIS